MLRPAVLVCAQLLSACASLGESAMPTTVDDAVPEIAVTTIPAQAPALPERGEIAIADDASLRVHVYGCGHAGCAGPTFEITLHADGRIEWVGIDDVALLGADTRSVDPVRVRPFLESASLIRWETVPTDARASPPCGSDGLQLMWTFDDGERIATGYDDHAREQPYSVDGGPECIAPELLPLRYLYARLSLLLGELEYLSRRRDFAQEWPSVYVPLVGDDIMRPNEVDREQRERISDFVRDAYDPAEHVVHVLVPAALATQTSTLRRRFARAGVPQSKLAVWVVPERLARRAIARIVPERCVDVRGPDDAIIHCPVDDELP